MSFMYRHGGKINEGCIRSAVVNTNLPLMDSKA